MQLINVARSFAAFSTFSMQVKAIPTAGSARVVPRQGYNSNCEMITHSWQLRNSRLKTYTGTATYVVQSGDYCNKIRDYFNDVWSLEELYVFPRNRQKQIHTNSTS